MGFLRVLLKHSEVETFLEWLSVRLNIDLMQLFERINHQMLEISLR